MTMLRLLLGCTAASLLAAPAALATAPGDNGQIAFRRFFDEEHRSGALFLVNPDGTGERQVTHPPAGFIDAQSGPPSFAPDGSKLVFTRSARRGNDALWTVDLRGGGERRLIPDRTSVYDHGVYSPDGRLIAFARSQGPPRRSRLRVSLNVMAASGGRVRRLVDLGREGDLGRIAWAPDGNRIVYEVASAAGRGAHALFVIASRGGRAHRIGPWRRSEFNSLDWSPDGRRLLIQLTPLGRTFGGDYYTLRPDGTAMHRLTHFGGTATTGAAAWSPDGTSIVFANAGVGGNDDIYVMQADGGAIAPVTRTPTWESAPAWGPAR